MTLVTALARWSLLRGLGSQARSSHVSEALGSWVQGPDTGPCAMKVRHVWRRLSSTCRERRAARARVRWASATGGEQATTVSNRWRSSCFTTTSDQGISAFCQPACCSCAPLDARSACARSVACVCHWAMECRLLTPVSTCCSLAAILQQSQRWVFGWPALLAPAYAQHPWTGLWATCARAEATEASLGHIAGPL